MNFFISIRWGNADSEDGPDGEDTHFLVRAHDFKEAAQITDEVLRTMPTTSATSKRSVQPFCHRIIEIGHDASSKSVPQILMGPWIAYGYNVHHVYYSTWERQEEIGQWEEVQHET